MSDGAEELQRRAEVLGEAKQAALDALSNGGAEAGALALIGRLKADAALCNYPRFFAFLELEARRGVIPGGSPGVRAWILGFRWPADPGGASALPAIAEPD